MQNGSGLKLPMGELPTVELPFVALPGELPAGIDQRVLAAAGAFPEMVAVEGGGRSLSYRGLEAASRALAARLLALGAGRERAVAIVAERSLEAVVAQLAVLRARSFFAPLLPSLPDERLRFVLDDLDCVAVLHLQPLAFDPGRPAISLAGVAEEWAAAELPAPAPAFPEELAYCIYTSGSTGKAKGVGGIHSATAALLAELDRHMPLAPGSRYAWTASPHFDVSIFEVFGAIARGGTLVVTPESAKANAAAYCAFLAEQRIATGEMPAAYLADFLAILREDRHRFSLEVLTVGTEPIPHQLLVDLLAELRQRLPSIGIFNYYGPTETTVSSTVFEVLPDGEIQPGKAPIGRLFAGTTGYLTLADGSGEIRSGELLLGGAGLTRGYLDRPALTAAAFVPDPYGAVPGARLYRTGDLARLLPSGDLEFLGRIDDQLKIRGYRIEPGEVATHLLRHPGLREAAVVGHGQGGEARLLAYLAALDPAAPPPIAELRRFLRRSLPEYMVPGSFFFLDVLPKTSTGKVDRRALPPPESFAPPAGGEPGATAAPREGLEQRLAEIWRELLGAALIGRDDDFFQLGGHSLIAGRMLAALQQELGLELPPAILFEAPTVALLAAEIEGRAAEGGSSPSLPAAGHAPEQLPQPLGFAQERLYFLYRLEPGSSSYNIPAAWRLRGPLDREALRRALGLVERRHAALRTRFREKEGEPYQLVLPPAGDFRLEEESLAEDALEARLRELAELPFDLHAGPPWRHRLLALPTGEQVLFVCVHHLVFDGLSLVALENELAAAYGAFLHGTAPSLPHLPYSAADFAVWQRATLKEERLAREVEYWRGRLSLEPLELPADRLRPPRQSHRGAVARRVLPAALALRLEALGRQRGATPFLTYLAPFLVLLSRLSGQRRVQVGVPFAGRGVAGSENLLGFFVNTLVLGLEIEPRSSWEDLLEPLRGVLAGALGHQEAPFEKLVAELAPERDPSRNPLFQVAFQLLEGEAEPSPWPGLAISRERAEVRAARFDFEPLLARGPGGEVEIEALYATDLFDAATVENWLALYENLLAAIAEAPARPLESVFLLTARDRALAAAINANATDFPADASLAALFAARAAADPERVAAEFRGEELSYRELETRSNRLAHLLRRRGALPGSMVGLCFERGIDLVVAILAVVKTGAAYVPLDGDYPEARLRGMIEDTAMPLLLGGRAQIARLPALGLPLLALEDLAAELAAAPESPLPLPPGGLAPAVVIFTSGSTGRPKAVVITQRGICRLLIATGYVEVRPGEIVTQVSSISFDAYTFELWGALLHGGRLLVIERGTLLDPQAFAAAIAGREIAAMLLTVTLFTQMMLEAPRAFARVRHLMFGGEACEPGIVRRALAADPAERPAFLQNCYGPAECTTIATAYEVKELAAGAGSVPIGRPIANTEALVLDRAGAPAAVGVHGELCLGGPGLALGYWRRPALTAAAFVPHPSSPEPGARLYRTGDLARLLPSGDLDYLGRIDFQVKVRGHRIELGEVEAVLGRHPAVREKIALTQGQGRDQRLVAFLTVGRDEAGAPLVSPAELERFAAGILPAFAVPRVQLLESMPLTSNGKIDRRALPKSGAGAGQPDGGAGSSGSAAAEPPRSESERQVAAAFAALLEIETPGREADFFALGGHSLLATRLIARLRETSGIALPIAALFAQPTVAGLARELDAAGGAPEAAAASAGAAEPGELSFAQQRLYFLHRFSPDSAVYNLPAAWRLRGRLDRGRLEKALAAVEARQEILRTRFRDQDGVGRAEALPPGAFILPGESVEPARLEERLAELAAESFDLLREKPWRARLLALGEADHVLFVMVHHIAFDGISLGIFERELAAFYRDPAFAPPPLAATYAALAARQKALLAGPALERQLAFWHGRAGSEPLELPTDRPRPPLPSFRGASLERILPADLVRQIEELGRRQGATPFLAFLAPFLMLLARLSGQREVSVGVPFSGRPSEEAGEVIGFFINTLPLTTPISGESSFAGLLPRLRQELAALYAHQDLPFEKLVEELGIGRDPSRNPLYQAVFQLFEDGGAKASFGDLQSTPLEPELRVAKFDLDLLLERKADGGLRVSAAYASDLFDAATVAGWLELYEILLRQVAATPAAPLSLLPLLRPADRALYARVNDNATAFPRDGSLLELFAARAAEGPQLIAAEYRGRTMSYRELDERTNRLARRLIEEGVEPGSMVGVCVERSIELVVAILAIVKTGSAYVPMDADYPAERLAGMAEDTRMPLILAGAAAEERLPSGVARVLSLSAAEAEAAGLSAEALPPGLAFAESAANVIFTSGSTGRPKGVVVTHRGVLRLVRDTNYIDLRPADVVVQASSASFDVYTFELWGALANGGRLLVIDRDTLLQPRAFAAALEGREIAALFLTVTLFGQMVIEQPRAFVRVRHLFFGGEACEPSVVRRALEQPPAHLQNGYGPTECTCYACVYEVAAMPGDARSVPIGPPVANTEVLVIDRFGQIAPVGVHGELCLGGDGLAWGYWRRPATTAAAFVPHPASGRPGERLYRTGDLARLLPSGDFDYLGRIDFQVKVRGFRIELGELEAVLGRHPAVREKIALTRGQGASQLLAAFVTVARDAAGEPLASGEELQQWCAAHLPAFAVPRVLVLETMPLTHTGKIDRRALPDLSLFAGEAAGSEPPRGELEEAVAEILAEVLGVPTPGRGADFFALGGHSLAAMRILSAMSRRLGFEAPLPLLFKHPVLADFAAAYGELRAAAGDRGQVEEPASAGRGEGPWPLSFGQERMWLLDQMRPGSSAFNMPFPLRLRGALDRSALERALAELELRHESLRTVFSSRDGVPWQEISPPSFALAFEDLSGLPAAELAAAAARRRDDEAAQPFDLAAGPLFRATLLRLGAEEHLLLTHFHHAIFDGWSAGVFFRELRQLLADFTAGRPSSLPAPGLPYADFARWQRELLQGELLERQLAYWREQLRGSAPLLALPLDRPRRPDAERRGAAEYAAIGPELAGALRQLAVRARSPLFPLLLAAFQVLLQRLSGQDDVLVGIPVADRPRQELEGTLGFFLNTLVIRNLIDGERRFEELFAATRDTVLAAREHQAIPFEKLVLELQPERSASQTPYFQVLFNFANLPDSSFALPGLEVELEPMTELAAKVDLNLYLFETGGGREGGLDLQLVYDADLFDRARMRELLRQYSHLLAQIAGDPALPAGRYSLRTPAAARHLPDPAAPLPDLFRETIAEGFLREAAADPGRMAVEDPWSRWSYGELEARSAAVAARLLREGTERGEVVAIWAHRSAPLVEALLGVLRAGAAFVILDPAYPLARLLDYLELAAPRRLILLAAAGPLPLPLEEAALAAGAGLLPLPAAGLPPAEDGLAALALAAPIGGEDLAYVAFTSGSTGRPKAVLGRHASLTAFLPFIAANFGFRRGDRNSLLSALSHDPLHRDVLMPLYFGATVVIPDAEQIFSPGYLAGWASRERLTVLNLVPAMLQLLLHSAPGEAPLELPELRLVFTVGDVLQRADIDALYALAPRVVAINLYGSTETQRAVSYVVLPRSLAHLDAESELGTRGLAKASLPVGRGYDGVQLVLRNAQGELAGVGEVGEILVRSRYLSRGYADPAQTAEKFLANPWLSAGEPGFSPDDRLYRSGDLGRYLPDGQVEFLGRADFQVKIRGFRIELQEIEAALARIPAIDASVVVVREDERGEKRLIAYFVPREGMAAPAGRDLRSALAAALPDYMVPQVFVPLRALPLTRTGKLDRLALPPAPRELADHDWRAPAPGVETELAGLWGLLLGRERIGADDHFFELGGHSLIATRLLARIRDSFGVTLPLRAVFEAPALASMAALIAAQPGLRLAGGAPVGSGGETGGEIGGEVGAEVPPLVAAPRAAGELLPLSFAQQRLWFLDQLEPESTAYLLAGAVALRGALDLEALEQAFTRLAERHEALRTRIVTRGGEGWQIVDPPGPLPLEPADLRRLPPAEREGAARALAEELARTPIPLGDGRLIRLRLLRLGEERHWLALAIHHIVADGWSVGILLRELGAIYAALREGKAPALPPLPLQPADAARWERSWLRGAALERQLAFWRRALEGAPHALELPADRPRPSRQTFRGARLPISLPAALGRQLRQRGREQGATLFMVLLTAYQILLARLAGQETVVVGTPVAHRQHTELEGLIGFFANTLPLRLDLDPAESFAGHLERLKHAALDAFAHQDLPFEKLVAELGIERDLARSPVFQAMFALQNLEAQVSLIGDLELENLELELGRAQLDLSCVLYEDTAGEEISGFLEWNADLFSPATIERFIERLQHLLAQVAADARRPAGELDLEVAADRLLRRSFALAEPIAAPLLPAAIAAYAQGRPQRIALGLEGEPAYAYGELHEEAGRLARHLRRLGAGPESVIGLSIGRTPAMVLAQLAIWQAGAAYLPLDPIYPAERLAFMLEDAGAEILVVDRRDEKAPAGLLEKARIVVDLADFAAGGTDEESAGWRPAEASPHALAYVLYTSGSTGKPKGVLIEHGALANFIASMARRPGLAENDRLLSVTTLSFDISGLEIWLPLAAGARVDLARRATLQDPELLAAAIEKNQTTLLQATPATWRLLLDGGWQGRPGLKALCGGEALPGELAARLLQKVGTLWNVYGPTETTIWSTVRQVLPAEGEVPAGQGEATVPLGMPIAATSIHILDPDGKPVPPGSAGQLCIGGRGLARGYRGRPALTAERFRPDPFSAEPGGRLYQTGDLARLRLDGELEFLGRLDFQVKVRGFRIELGEIEAALLAHPLIAEAVVVARGDGPSGSRLVGYFRVVPGADEPSAAELQEFLRRGLPEYMVPPHLMAMGAFPLTPNLKIDRRALPAPEIAGGGDFRPPAGPAEIALAAIWQELLGAPRVGAGDNFFALGGDSILVIQMIARARGRGLAFKPHDVFLQPSLAALALAARPVASGAAEASGGAFDAAAGSENAGRRQGVDLVGELSDEDFADLLDSFGK